MKNNAKVGGILSIVAGAWGALGALCLIIVGVVMVAMMNGGGYSDYYPGFSEFFVGAILIVVGFCCGLPGNNRFQFLYAILVLPKAPRVTFSEPHHPK